ncbi:MAG: Na-translocating system protein MpsC family protein [Cyanobacteria bacterium P01_A01_bin.83]
MNNKVIRTKKIESLLSQKIKNVYRVCLEHKLDNISYKLFDRTLIVTLEGTITSPEKFLKDNDHLDIAIQVRETIDNIIHPQIQDIIEEVLNVKVVDYLSDTTIDNDLTGAIAIFEFKSRDI